MTHKVVMDAQAVADLFDAVFPQVRDGGRQFEIMAISPGESVLRLTTRETHLRPGGTVSGPSLFALADLGAYAVILGHVGPKALAVTTNLNINFMRKAEPGALVCTTRLLKLGKRLAVTDCVITSETTEGIIAHASATYSIPAE